MKEWIVLSSRSPRDLHFKNNATARYAAFCHRYDTRRRSALAPHKIKPDNSRTTRTHAKLVIILKPDSLEEKIRQENSKKDSGDSTN